MSTRKQQRHGGLPNHGGGHGQHGLTLIEFVIGVAVIGILFMLGAPSFSAWIQNTKIRTATEAIQNGIQLARAEAVRRNAPVQFVLGAGTSWTVGCVTVSANCPSPIQSRSSAEGATASVTVAADQATTVVFNGLGRMTAPAANDTLDITNPATGACANAGGPMRCLRIVVTTGGQVRMCDPALALATNPQGCV